MTMAFEVAGEPEAHGDALDVRTQVMASLLTGTYVWVTLVAPEIFEPFFFHW